jgi:uncharacterized protein (TIGR03545 family)
MKKWIRWQGLGVFLGVVIIFCLFWFLLIDGIVERMIEKSGTRAVGAKVELDKADLSLFPAGLKLIRLQIANPDEPMTNAVEIAQINLSLETMNLLRRKIIIEEMTVDGIRMNTPRKRSGAVVSRTSPPPASHKAPKKGQRGEIELPTFKVPNVSEVLKREKLQSLELVEALQKDIQNTQKKWQKQLQELPDKAKFDEYRGRIQQLESKRKAGLGGLLGAAGDVANLKRDLQTDLNRLKRAQQGFDRRMTSFKVQVDQATKAPLKDVERLKKRYSLSPQGLTNLSRLLLGYQLRGWTEKLITWYERVKSVLERVKKKEKGHEVVKPMRGKGVNIRFKEYAPLPDFLIRKAKARLRLQDGDLKGKIENITPDQDILGIPLTFRFSGENMKRLDAITIDGSLDHIMPARSKDKVNFNVEGYEVRDMSLSDKAEWPVTLETAVADLDIQALLRGENISANLIGGLKSVRLSAGSHEADSPLAQAMASALSNISQLTLNADLNGTLEDYDIQVTSDLDRVLKSAASKVVQNQGAALEKELNKAISAKVGGPLEQTKGRLSSLNAIGNELNKRLNLGNSLLSGLKLPF